MSDLNRCWLGFPLPTDLQTGVKAAQLQVKKRAGGDAIRWLPPGEIALLLVSVGEVGSNTLLRVGSVVEQVVTRHRRMSLTLEGVGGSPNATMPKTAWIGIGGDVEALKRLRTDLAVCAKPLVTAIDEREFEPVVEIGVLRRFDDRARTEMGRSLKMATVGLLGDFTVDAVHILASHATTGGPALYSLKTVALAQ